MGGASVEEAFAKTLETNTTLTRLGLNLQNPHWRDMIDRRLMQNADKRRKTRLANKRASKDAVLEVPAGKNELGQENAPPTVQPSGYPVPK